MSPLWPLSIVEQQGARLAYSPVNITLDKFVSMGACLVARCCTVRVSTICRMLVPFISFFVCREMRTATGSSASNIAP